MRPKAWLCALSLFAVIATPSPAYADLIWPALFIEPRLLAIPTIVIGYLVEVAMLRFGFAMSWRRAFLVSLAVNSVSTAAGCVAYPFVGLGVDYGFGTILNTAGDRFIGTWFVQLIQLAMEFLLAISVTTTIEVLCLRLLFKIPLTRRTWLLWSAANAVSVGIAFASFALAPANEQHLYFPWLVR